MDNTVRQIFVLYTQKGVFETVITNVRLRGSLVYSGLSLCSTQLPCNIKSEQLELPKYLCYNTFTWKTQLCLFKLKTVLSHPLVTAVPIFLVFSGFVLILSHCAQAAASFLLHLETNQCWLSLAGYP